MAEKQDGARDAQAIRSIDGFLWTIYAFSGAGTGFALAIFRFAMVGIRLRRLGVARRGALLGYTDTPSLGGSVRDGGRVSQK
jgi:hypothetical protein